MAAFFSQLEEFSARVFDFWRLPRECKWVGKWANKIPRGAILHYTKGGSIKRTVRYFMIPKYKAKASAHVVVAPGWLSELDHLAVGLPLVRALGVTVIQCVPLDKAAWHATWTNGLCYGIEQVNLGEFKRGQEAGGGVTPIPYYGRLWDPYPVVQIEAVILFLRELRREFNTLRRNWVLGHEQVQGVRTPGSSRKDKRDPGPHYPFEIIRGAVFDFPDTPFNQLPEWKHYMWDRFYVRMARASLVLRLGKQDLSEAWKIFPQELNRWVSGAEDGGTLFRALQVLGYDPDTNLEESVFVFRRMEGLPLNEGIDTPDFRVRVRNRVLDRFF